MIEVHVHVLALHLVHSDPNFLASKVNACMDMSIWQATYA